MKWIWPQIKASPTKILGFTQTLKMEIPIWKIGSAAPTLLLIGGVHGDEPEGFYMAERFLAECPKIPATLWLLPRLNPEGCKNNERTNGRGVDLNRNMPTHDWDPVAKTERYQPGPAPSSEVETQILIKLIEEINPRLIVSLHSWNPIINYNGPSQKVAEIMAKFNKYKIADDIGYPTPGSLGTWAGQERKIPTITLEIEKGSEPQKIWATHAKALEEAFLFASREEKLA